MTLIRLDLDRPSVTAFAKVFSKVLRLYKLFAGSGAEQVVFALQNFLFTVLAARLTTTEQFARFVTEVAIVLLCFLLSSSLVNTPALVLLHKRYSSRKIEYLNSLRIFASLLGVLAPLLFIPILFLVGIKLDFVTLGGMAALHYSMLSYDLQRRWANVTDKLKVLFLQTTIASVFALIIATLMAEYRVLSDSTIQFAFAIPFIIISWCSWLRDLWTIGYTNSLSKLREILVDHWIFAWALIISNFLHWISTQGYFLVAAKLLSATDLGGLRTTQSLCSVLNIAFIVFENRATPLVTKLEIREGETAVKAWANRVASQMQFPLVVGSILLAPLLAYAHSVLYGANYSNYSYLVVFFLAHLVFHGLSRPYAVGLKASERNIGLLYGYGLSAIASIGLSCALVQFGGVLGAAFGFILSSLLLLIVLRTYFR